MNQKIMKPNLEVEFLTTERCYISEIWNSSEDESVSIVRAKVLPGVTTALHYLEDVDERYLIINGKGRVEVGDLPQTEVGPGDLVVIPAGISQRITNVGEDDLVFYCICSPRFNPDCYHDIESD